MLVAIYTFGEPLIAEIVPLSEVSKISQEVLEPQYWGRIPNSDVSKHYEPIWITGNGDIFIKEGSLDSYSTPATVHGDWKLRLHQKIVYAIKSYDIPCFRADGTYMSANERRRLFVIASIIVSMSDTFEEAVEKLKEDLGIATCVRCGQDFYISPNYKGNKPMCPSCRSKC